MPSGDVAAVQRTAILAAFAQHFEHNEEYQRYCVRRGVTPDDLPSLESIPLLTSTQFKQRDILTSAPEKVVKVCMSSGTLGSTSRVHRDETTLSRFLGSVQCSIDHMFGLDDAFCLHLGPSTAEAGDLWISYVLSLSDLVFPTENTVRGGAFYPERVVEALIAEKDNYESLVLVGAPVMFLELIRHMEDHAVRIAGCENVMVMTGGGWKRHAGDMIPRDRFEALLTTHLQGLTPESFRDSFNMVELNAVFPECECRAKHVPPWLCVVVFDPQTLTPAPPGRCGLLAFLDPSPTSYPGFVLTDDLAILGDTDSCPCGRSGKTVQIVRRVKTVEARGCALKIDQRYARSREP